MKVIHYHRRKDSFMWSMEKLFAEIRTHFPSDISVSVEESPYMSQGFWPRLKNIVAAHKTQGDVNHITGDIHYIALGLTKQKSILTIHDLGFMNQYKGFSRFLLWLFWIYLPIKRVRYVTAISVATKAEILRFTRCNPDKITIIPNFVSPDFTFSPKIFNRHKPTILQIGTLFNKNIERLFKALNDIPCKLIIVGELTQAHHQLLQYYNIDYENRSELSEAEIVAAYRECDFVSFCSLLEGFGLPILEGQATGRPVITSNLSSMPEVAGKAALFVDPYDVNAIRKGILTIIQNESFRQNLITNGLENIKRFSPQKVADAYVALYMLVSQGEIH
ncbi:MAG: glycosyltransferase family 1 protein [Bacteroidia bacterium]|nr:glycosyltransferase family 1 protein [Bacteroidia bacterium]